MKVHTDEYGMFAALYFASCGVIQYLRWIPPGEFLMGSPEDELERHDDEGPQHEVRISGGFWLFDTPVTQALWAAVMGDNPSHFKDNPWLPVEQVSWDDAMRFIARLNSIIPGLNLALPTEAQWEYAARAGTTTPFWCGPSIDTDQANYDGNRFYADGPKGEFREKTVPVKAFKPNPWGLHDMHGNVWEWCADGMRRYGSEAVTDPVGPLDRIERVLRGGAWINCASDVRAAYRFVGARDYQGHHVGFRCALVES